MSKQLVAYFSASGVTAKVARALAESIDADLYEIEPAIPYTKADLDWMDKKSRSTIEMNDPSSRPAVRSKLDGMESYDMSGKTIIPFATSGGSGMGKTNEKLAPSCPNAKLLEGRAFKQSISKAELSAWADGIIK